MTDRHARLCELLQRKRVSKRRLRAVLDDDDSPSVDWNAPDRRGWPPLAIAAQRGHADAVAMLLRRGASLLAHTVPARNTALHVAALFEQHDVLLLLQRAARDAGLNLMHDVRNVDGDSPSDLADRALSARLRRESERRQKKRAHVEVQQHQQQSDDSEEEAWREKLLAESFLVDGDAPAPSLDERSDSRTHLDAMSDDEYAAYVRGHMHRRGEPPQQQQQQRPPPRSAPTEKRSRPAEAPRAVEPAQPSRAARLSDYEQRYGKFLARVAAGGDKLRLRDIAWPLGTEPDRKGDTAAMEASLLELFGSGERGDGDAKALLRAQLLRWHSDKFVQKFGRLLDVRDADLVLARVTLIAQCLTQLLERVK